jgi:hypothetical protein
VPPAAATALIKKSPNPLMFVARACVIDAFLDDLFVGTAMRRQKKLLNY